MTAGTLQSVAEVMKERSSTRKYKRNEKIPQDTLNQILELAGTAPSSWNLQHFVPAILYPLFMKIYIFFRAFIILYSLE